MTATDNETALDVDLTLQVPCMAARSTCPHPAEYRVRVFCPDCDTHRLRFHCSPHALGWGKWDWHCSCSGCGYRAANIVSLHPMRPNE